VMKSFAIALRPGHNEFQSNSNVDLRAFGTCGRLEFKGNAHKLSINIQ